MNQVSSQNNDDAADGELLARIAAKDRLALRTFFARYHLRIYRFLVRMTRNEALAEELVNETLMSVWTNAASFQGQSAVSSWVFAIARNKAISVLRKRSEEALDETQAASIEDGADTPEVTSMKTDKAAALRQCMSALSDEHREVIELVYYQEKSVKQVADITGIPQNTVKTRMYHARQNLGALMRDAGLDRGWP